MNENNKYKFGIIALIFSLIAIGSSGQLMTGDQEKVNKTGDIMTGQLSVPVIYNSVYLAENGTTDNCFYSPDTKSFLRFRDTISRWFQSSDGSEQTCSSEGSNYSSLSIARDEQNGIQLESSFESNMAFLRINSQNINLNSNNINLNLSNDLNVNGNKGLSLSIEVINQTTGFIDRLTFSNGILTGYESDV